MCSLQMSYCVSVTTRILLGYYVQAYRPGGHGSSELELTDKIGNRFINPRPLMTSKHVPGNSYRLELVMDDLSYISINESSGETGRLAALDKRPAPSHFDPE